ncbi:MAG TPA: poly-gamma-glutamate biosynthesis protein PgsC [Phycisphaerae bacterium]|nr:poly-gamma-glutamate biosynthesis protein PgsC [Phycisphaerae bacterium]HUU21370.1 poly-gamma-glutamate biosynthesis protein PgsC [Phycisphaerae bacterium]
MVEVALGLGLLLSIAFGEVLGLAAGGMVVPGYLAMELPHPGRLAMTFVCALATYALVQGASRFMLVYGRRRTVAMILVGFLLRGAIDRGVGGYLPEMAASLQVVGYIIPGLLAIWMARQGVVETISTGIMAAVVIRLCLILLVGWGLLA